MAESWSDGALCIGQTDLFFSEKPVIRVMEAKALCRVCPCENACLNYAVKHEIDFGTWGGKTARERGWNPKYNRRLPKS